MCIYTYMCDIIPINTIHHIIISLSPRWYLTCSGWSVRGAVKQPLVRWGGGGGEDDSDRQRLYIIIWSRCVGDFDSSTSTTTTTTTGCLIIYRQSRLRARWSFTTHTALTNITIIIIIIYTYYYNILSTTWDRSFLYMRVVRRRSGSISKQLYTNDYNSTINGRRLSTTTHATECMCVCVCATEWVSRWVCVCVCVCVSIGIWRSACASTCMCRFFFLWAFLVCTTIVPPSAPSTSNRTHTTAETHVDNNIIICSASRKIKTVCRRVYEI